MPELIDTPVTLGDFAEVIPAERTLYLVATGPDGEEGRIRVDAALQLLEAGDLPDIPAENVTAALVDSISDNSFLSTDEMLYLTGSTLKRGAVGGLGPAIADLKWLSKGIGEFYYADDGVTGVDIPPSSTSGSTVWVELTAALTGSGQFNEGKLGSESVSGSAPLVQATAVVTLSGSPMNGQTIRLINSERRYLRAGVAGTIEADAMQGHRHQMERAGSATAVNASAGSSPTGVFNTSTDPVSDGTNGTPRTANETRVKGLGIRVFRRIK